MMMTSASWLTGSQLDWTQHTCTPAAHVLHCYNVGAPFANLGRIQQSKRRSSSLPDIPISDCVVSDVSDA